MIEQLFLPTMYVKNYKNLDVGYLKVKGIKVFVLDVDNTLISHQETSLNHESLQFIKMIKMHGIVPVIVSNNVKKRVELVANEGELDYYSFSCKPLKMKYKKVLAKYDCHANEVAILGDQLITDILGGNRMKFFTILQDPITSKDNTSGRVTRKIETWILHYLEKKNKWKKGGYYDEL